MGVRAGEHRHRVVIQSPTKTRTGTGGFVDAWANVATNVSASVDPLHGRERWTNQQVQGETTHAIGMRHRSGITPENRILFGPRVFHVIEVLNPGERNIKTVIMAKEVTA